MHKFRYQSLYYRREPRRRVQIHDQLQRARHIRASLEEAANLADALPSNNPSSSSEAMSILQSSLPQINQLVRLTEVLRGKGTIDNPEMEYEEWNEWTRYKNEVEEEERLREKRMIRRQLREFAKEKNDEIEINEELERRHDALIPKPSDNEQKLGAKVPAEEVYAYDNEPESDDEFIPQTSQFARSNSARARTQSESEDDLPMKSLSRKKSSYIRQKSDEGARKRPPEASQTLYTRQPAQAKKKAKVVDSGTVMRLTPGGTYVAVRKNPPQMKKTTNPDGATIMAKPIVSMATSSFRTIKVKAAPVKKDRPTKKCHYCRKPSIRYRNCNYWSLTGVKCLRKFCIDCLSSKYTLGDDVKSATNPNGKSIEEILLNPKLDAEWHCPGCLGTCQCDACVTQRKKDEEREKIKNEAARKSSRRSAMGNNYSYFF